MGLAAAVIAVGLIGWPQLASATRARPMSFTCPLGGAKYEAIGGIRRGRTPSGVRLDARPLGRYVLASGPHQCENGFVIYKDKFSAAELAKLKPIVRSAEYQKLAKEHATNFLAAYLMQRMGASREELTSRYLRASWQAEGQWPPPDEDETLSAKDAALVQTYREAALRGIEESLAKGRIKPKAWWINTICAADLERLLGRFDLVEKRLASAAPGNTQPSAFEAAMISQITKYASQRDKDPHAFEGSIPDVGDIYEERRGEVLFPMIWVP
jgi:hypothetical protein